MASFGDLNSFICLGRLTRDPEIRYTPSGAAYCRMGIAVNRSYKSGEEIKENVLFINVVSWGKQGESCAQYLTKGRRIIVNGELRSNNWTDKEGIKRYNFEVTANSIQFLDGKKTNGNNNEPEQNNNEQEQESEKEIPEDEIPF